MQARLQLTLFPLTCARCEEPILPGQPYAQTSSVDVVDGWIAASPVRSYHTEKGCYRAAKLEQWAAESARAPIAA
ncbi:MAG: hypothetical protein F4045_10880 [Chloroflexi bacterium]|nr:hypothetical protein [Chloroflexota bacterium]MYK35573.1 hypothetical protein [Chloroflexota bacterium]